MPKNKRKDKKERYLGRGGGAENGDASVDRDATTECGDDDMETMSVCSGVSVNDFSSNVVDDIGSRLLSSDKLACLVEEVGGKNAQHRITALRNLSRYMCHQFLDLDENWNHLDTLKDMLERSLKRGSGFEQEAAANLFGQLCLQLDSELVSERLGSFRMILRTLMLDQTAALISRTAAATALGCGTFLSSDTSGSKLQEIMADLESVYRASFLKGDKSVPSHPPEVTQLHTAALESWALLLTIASSATVERVRVGLLPRLPELLLSSDVSLRIAAGETLALLYELFRLNESRENFVGFRDLMSTLQELSTDGDKSRSKTDRRVQRSSFRDILASIQCGDSPVSSVKFGAQDERLYMDTWFMKRRYDGLCTLLGQGINTHLTDNMLVRDIFELGEPLPRVGGNPSRHGAYASKTQRNAALNAAHKDLTQRRDQQRSKRQAMCHQSPMDDDY